MTSREESNALEHVRDLLARDITKAELDEIAEGIREAELLYDESPRWVGRLVTELKRRELSWADIRNLTGIASTTLRQRVSKFEEEGRVSDA